MTTTLADAPPRTSWAPLLVVLTGTFMTFLDFFIVNVALPSIETDLHAGPSTLSLVVAGYGLAFAAGMITGGRLGDLYGRRAMFRLGLALFTLTSVVAGLAPSAGVLVGARVLQGASGALLTPQVLAIVATTYVGAQRARAFAAFGVAMGLAGVLGQLVGGALIVADPDGLGWRAIFLINAPVGLVAVVATRVVPESRGVRARLDHLGVVLGSLALVALVLPLAVGREHHWPAWTLLCLAAAPIVGATFVRRQQCVDAPLVAPSLFADHGFTGATVVGAVFGMVPPSFFLLLAFYLQQERGYGPLPSGVIFTAVGVGYFTALLVAPWVEHRLGRHVLSAGAVGVGLGCGAVADAAHLAPWVALTPGLAVVGFGIGLVLVPLSARALVGVELQHAASAAGTLTTAQQVGGALGVCLTGTVYFAGTTFGTCLWLLAGLSVAAAAAVWLVPNGPVTR